MNSQDQPAPLHPFVAPRRLSTSREKAADAAALASLGILLALYAFFMVTDDIFIPGAVVVGLLWTVRSWASRQLTVPTPLDVPILALVLMLPVTLYASVDWTLSAPKVHGLLLSIAIFYALANLLESSHRLRWAALALVPFALGVVALGLLGVRMPPSQLIPLRQLQDRLPRLIQGLPRAAAGFNPNGIGGTLVFLVPPLASLLWWDLTDRPHSSDAALEGAGGRHESQHTPSGTRLPLASPRWLWPLALALSLLLTLLVLLLTQSRGALVGLAAGVLAVAVWRRPRLLWGLPVAAAALAVVVAAGRGRNLVEFLLRLDTSGRTIPVRLEIWQRAVYMIQDFPFTGIGIGTFDQVADILYPFFLIPPGTDLGHAHNELLEVAVDLGIPGLVAYVGALSSSLIAAWRAWQFATIPWHRPLAVGLAGGLLAHQAFGLTDAFLLGTKPGLIIWLFMAVVMALYRANVPPAANAEPDLNGRTEGGFLLTLGYWILFALLAISFVGNRPYVALGTALAGGFALGFLSERWLQS